MRILLENVVAGFINSLVLVLRIYPGDKFPDTLSKCEEEELLQKWYSGNVDARNELVEHNLRLVAHIIKKYYYSSEETDELISIGTIGLIKGINTYKPDKSVRLATYASKCIENELLMHFRGRKKAMQDVSLSDILDPNGEDLTIMDVIGASDDMAETVEAGELSARLNELVKSELSEREAAIIALRYGIGSGEPKTQNETAAAMKISRSYVSRIEKRAIEKLRAALIRDDMI